MATYENTNPNLYDILSSLPEDIIYDILFIRLTVKDLSRLKSVCKSWLSLISSPEFIKTHLFISTNDPHFTHHRLILTDWTYEPLVLWTCSVYSLLHETFTDTLPYDDLDIESIVGHCNGLVIGKGFKDNNQLFLWNPSTRKLKTLPKLDRISDSPPTVYGFCYDELDNDFKVFAISPAHDYFSYVIAHEHGYEYEYKGYEYKISVYSLKSDCWKMVGDFPFRAVRNFPLRADGNCANGAIYWIVVTPEMQKKIIVSLDIRKETCSEVLLPNFGDGVYDWRLGTFDKSLSVLCQYENSRADFWIMKEPGVTESWTKLFTIPYKDKLITRDSYLKPICISMNGDIMLILASTLVLYNLKDKRFKRLLTDLEFIDLDVCTYVESLVSPHL